MRPILKSALFAAVGDFRDLLVTPVAARTSH